MLGRADRRRGRSGLLHSWSGGRGGPELDAFSYAGHGPASSWAPHPASSRSYIVLEVYWPLIGGFIAFILVLLLLGWWTDPSRRGDADGH